jgi:outer membrane lipoprotein-sorting protein
MGVFRRVGDRSIIHGFGCGGAANRRGSATPLQGVVTMRRMRWIVGLVAVCSLSGSVWADAVDDVIKKLDESLAKIKSFSMKMKMESTTQMGEMKSRTDAQGTMEFLRKDAKELTRTEMDMKSEMSGAGMDQKMSMKSLQISDGHFSWSLVEHMEGPQKGLKFASKSEYQGQMMSAKSMKDLGVLKLLPEEKVDGADCYVIEATMKEMPNTKQVSYFRKADGIAAKAVTLTDGKPTGTMTMTDIKVNSDISADRFVFKAPEGVEVQDTTKAATPAAPAVEKP